MLNIGMVLQGRYEIIKVIGHGGMSTVYQARDIHSGRLLAVKDVARSGKTDDQIVEQSLVGEGRMLMQLSEPHLPRIYEIIENTSSFMLVMDYIEGQSLDKVIAQQGPQDMAKVLDWGMQICKVFHYLHNQPTPIIYRDMKPANVMLQPDGQLMMIDFGTARVQKLGVAMQADTICIGTAGFAAPEQFGGIGQSDARTDIFCLGATLYNLITGHSPSEPPKGIFPLERWNPALKGTPLAGIIYKCTRNDPYERYQTAMELHEELRLASVGSYRGIGGFRKSQWQQQELRGSGMITNGLSTLLQSSKTSGQKPSGSLKREQVPAPALTAHSAPATSVQTDVAPILPETATYLRERFDPQGESMKRLTLIGLVTAAVFALLTVALGIMEQMLSAAISIIVALGGVALAVAGILLQKRLQQSADNSRR